MFRTNSWSVVGPDRQGLRPTVNPFAKNAVKETVILNHA
jgi:hypothetical protein